MPWRTIREKSRSFAIAAIQAQALASARPSPTESRQPPRKAAWYSLDETGIANAGVGGENHYGEKDRWDEIIETNLGGTYHLTQEALPALRASNEPFRPVSTLGFQAFSIFIRRSEPDSSGWQSKLRTHKAGHQKTYAA